MQKAILSFFSIGILAGWVFICARACASDYFPGINNVLKATHPTGAIGNAFLYKEIGNNEFLVFSVAHLCHSRILTQYIDSFAENHTFEETSELLNSFTQDIIKPKKYCALRVSMYNNCASIPIRLKPLYIDFSKDVAIFTATIPQICTTDGIRSDITERYNIKTPTYIPFVFFQEGSDYSFRSIAFTPIGLQIEREVLLGGNTGRGMSGSAVFNEKTRRLIGVYRAIHTGSRTHSAGRFARIEEWINPLKTLKNYEDFICIDDGSNSCKLATGEIEELRLIPRRE